MFSLPALGNIGEFVGAIAVIVSLIYLARQTIHNTRSVQAASATPNLPLSMNGQSGILMLCLLTRKFVGIPI
jgi:hypothetical protein